MVAQLTDIQRQIVEAPPQGEIVVGGVAVARILDAIQTARGWYHDRAQQHGQQYFRNLLDNRAYLVLIAEEHGEVVGYLAGSTSEAGELRTVRSAELESMCVAPASRGRRPGESLVHAFLQWARGQGAA